MIGAARLADFWQHWRVAIIGALATGFVAVCWYFAVWAVNAWADQKLEPYVESKALTAAVHARDLKNVNERMRNLELEIQRVDIWITFSSDPELKQIYGAEKALLEAEKLDVGREREELVKQLGDPDGG